MQTRNAATLPKSLVRIDYEIPERYRDAFYLANAAFFDSTNWFLHRTYEVIFPSLKNAYRQAFRGRTGGDRKIHEKLENIVESLDQCNSIIDVRFPIKREKGNWEVVRGFRAYYGEIVQNAPCLGGLRIHEDITRDQMKALAVISSMKNLCLGTGLSGAMGGIKINPKNYTETELRHIVSIYVTELFKKGYCNHTDIVQPDINTGKREMKWISEAFASCSGQNLNATSTGKPLEYGGVEDFETAGALGAFKALKTIVDDPETLLKTGRMKAGLKDKRFIIQGLGKLGKPLGLLLTDAGAVCVGVKEKDAYLYDAKGINLQDLYKYMADHATIENFGLSKTEYPDSIFTEECDILVLAAFQKSLNCHVARDVKARIILEAADGPVTPTAHRILTTKSKLVIPDIYACAGTNLISYFEYLKNLQQIGLSEDNILRCSTEIYRNIFKSAAEKEQQRVAHSSQTHYTSFTSWNYQFTNNNCIECIYSEVGQEILKNLTVFKLGVDLRTAAYALAIKNMFDAIFRQNTLI